MGTLEEELQKIYEAKIGVSITWLWDGGVDVRLLDRSGEFIAETQVETVGDVLSWLEVAIGTHYPNARYKRGYQTAVGKLQTELQKIYDSEINIEISWLLAGAIRLKIGNEFYGFDEEATVRGISDILPWLQRAIHDHYCESQYDVERRGEKWEPKWFGPGKPASGLPHVAEPLFECPNCKARMAIIGDGPSNVRVCPECATLAWENQDGTTETRRPEEVVE